MVTKAFETEILRSLNLLERDQQNKVLDYIKSLLKFSKSNQHDMLRFAGDFSPKELELMSQAIEEGCEGIDKNEW
jgi:hypothetical protein